MPCHAAVCQLPGHRMTRRPQGAFAVLWQLSRRGVQFLTLVCLWLTLAAPTVQAQGVDVLDLKPRRDEAAVSLDYQLRVTLPHAVEDAALRGVPIYFSAEATLWRTRWYWRDERIARVHRDWRVSFQPLTSNWRVSQGGLGQSFSSLAEAMGAITGSIGWRVADARDVDSDSRHTIAFSWRLDTSQLPRPMQIGLTGLGGAGDWSVGVERTVKLAADSAK